MKNIFIGIIIGIILVALIAGMTPQGRQIFLLEPIVPSETIVLDLHIRLIGWPPDYHEMIIQEKIQPYLKKGFIVQSVASTAVGTTRKYVIVILVKY